MSDKTVRKSTLEQLHEELFDAFPDDPSAPGVQTSKVKETPRPRYYASIVRFTRPAYYGTSEGRVVVASARAGDLGLAIRELMKEWRKYTAKKKNEDESKATCRCCGHPAHVGFCAAATGCMGGSCGCRTAETAEEGGLT